MVTPSYRSVRSFAAAAGIEHRLATGGPIPLAELDDALAKVALSTASRIALKATLNRLGLLT